MAYDYLGTMDRDQFDDLVAFARKQKTLIKWQNEHARAEIKRLDSLLAKLHKAHDVFFGGGLGVGQTLPTFRERDIFEADDPDSFEGGADLEITVPVNEPFFEHAGREEAFRVKSPSLKLPVFDLRDALHDADTAEVSRAIKTPFQMAIKHQRENLEWRIRKVQDRQEQLEELRRRREIYSGKRALEIFVSEIDRMFSRSFEPNDNYWWNLNPQPGSTNQKRPEVVFRVDRYTQSQKELKDAIDTSVEFSIGQRDQLDADLSSLEGEGF